MAPFDVSVQQPIPPVEGPRAVSPPSREQRLPAISYADMAKKQQSAVPNEEEPTPNLLKPGTTPGLQGPQKNEFRPQQRQHVLPPSQPVTARFVPSLGGVVRYSGGSGGGEKLDSGLRKAASTMDDSTQQPEGSVLLLISSQSFKREVTIQQNKMSTVLDLYKIPFVTFDGADPANKDRRNELFGLSGLRGQYPQVFITAKENNEMSYWGDYGRFESAHESGTLSSELGGTVLEIDVDASAKNKSNGTDKSYLSASTSSLLVLISRQSLTREVVANQERAFAILKSKGIVFETIDGADPANKDVRNNLFEISGIRAKYPQFFLVQNGEMDFWGDWDRFQRCNEDGSLEQAIVTASTETSQSSLHVVPASTAIACEEKDPFVRVTKSRGFAVELPTVARAAMETTPSAVPVSPDPVTFTEATKTDKVSKPHEVSRSIAKQSSKAVATMALSNNLVTEITVYGATSFVANHALDYLMQVSLSTSGSRTVTLAGRSKSKIAELQARLTLKMTNYLKTISKPKGQCTFDTFVADSSNKVGLEAMARRTKLVINFAGPFTNYGENIVAACAQNGTDYIDITGEVAWAGDMRQKYSEAAEKSGARIISFCGFDSVPSDLAVFAAVVALRKATRSNSEIESATCWHSCLGIANGGTVHSAIGIPMNLRHCFSQPVPFLLNDPLALAHPRTRVDPINQSLKNRMAKVEWLNQLPSFDSILSMGVSAPFFMSVVNAKIVNASAVALNYGPNFAYRERMLPLGMKTTKTLRVLSLFPAMFVQFGILFAGAVLMTPVIGKMIANWIAPPGSGAPDSACKAGYADVYSEVSTAPAVGGLVHRANCSLKFEGDPGNWVTAQCVMEAALSLILEKEKLPSRSKDGFGTPAELLGMVLVNRLQKSSVRPVLIATNARKNVNRRENTTFC